MLRHETQDMVLLIPILFLFLEGKAKAFIPMSKNLIPKGVKASAFQ